MNDGRTGSVPVEEFEALFKDSRDPFDLEDRWYERRKRAVTLAALEREHYPEALELACAEGALTEALAPRCGRLLAVDGSATAVRRARRRLARVPSVTVRRATLPDQLPAASFDLTVIAEVGYYLVTADLDELVRRAVAATRRSGELVAVHWRHPSAAYPSDGDRVHDRLHDLLDRTHRHLVEVTHPDFLVDSWRIG